MGKLVSLVFSPVTMLWALMESRIWLSMSLVTLGIAIAWPLKFGAATVVLMLVLSVLLMRADPVAEEQAAAKAAAAG
jgi:hypothetical protein